MIEMLKTRTISVSETTTEEGEKNARVVLAAVPGVKKVEAIGTGKLRVEYDLAKIRLHQIEENIRALGFTLPGGILARWRRDWIGFTEVNEYNNMTGKPAPCCSNPKGIVAPARGKNRP